MKKTLQFIAISVLLSAMGWISSVTSAESTEKIDSVQKVTPSEQNTQTPSEPIDATDAEDSPTGDDAEEMRNSLAKNVEGITLQHRINAADTPQPITQIKADPLILLQTFKQDIIGIIHTNGKPLKITSEIKLLLSETLSKQIGELPSVTVETNIDADGKGLSKIVFPAYQHVEPAAGEIKKFTIDFKGMDAQLEFTEDFVTSNYHIDFSGLSIEEEGQYKFGQDKTSSEGKFDADFVSLRALANLSKIEFNNSQEAVKILIENGFSETTLEKLKNAVEVQTGSLKLGKFELQYGDTQSKFDRLEANFGAPEQADTVDFFLNSKCNGTILPKEVVQESLTLHYNSQLVIRHLAAASIVELQQSARDFEKQRVKGTISQETMYLMLFSKFMEIAPKLAIKSPELALNDFSLKTNHGQLIGNTSLGIDGAKFKSLEDVPSLINALQMQADLTISKKLLQQFLTSIYELGIEDDKTDKKQSKQAVTSQIAKEVAHIIDELLKEKWLVEQADDYHFVASLKANKFIVNGTEKPSPLNEFIEGEPAPVAKLEKQAEQADRVPWVKR